MGVVVEVQEVAPGRPNVVATLEGRAPGRSLMLCGHIDTVGVAGMAAPFAPMERDGRLYGRGAQDMKSGVAAMVDAVRAVAEGGGLGAGRVMVACVVDEEHSSIGADALVTRWRADAGVVTEPTDLDIAVAHKGFEWAEVETIGRAAHGSRPAEGIDAILPHGPRARRARGRSTRAAGRRRGTRGWARRRCTPRSSSGGRELSSYPDRCTLQVERRTLPGERRRCAGPRSRRDCWRGCRPPTPAFQAHATTLFGRPPYEVDAAHPLPGRARPPRPVAPAAVRARSA